LTQDQIDMIIKWFTYQWILVLCWPCTSWR